MVDVAGVVVESLVMVTVEVAGVEITVEVTEVLAAS